MATIHVSEYSSLEDKTTMRVGGKARFFVSVTSEEELVEAINFVKEKELAFFVLGGGSNIVVSDGGFSGLVIKNDIRGKVSLELNDSFLITASSGENWDALVEETTQLGLWGIENLSLIPGSVGAAPVQNIGAYGTELASVVESVRAYDSEKGIFKNFTKEECRFSYRNSLFKQNRRYIIVSVTIRLSKTAGPVLEYEGVQREIEKRGLNRLELTPIDMRSAIISIRTSKLPDWRSIPTAGSFFKNPEITESHFRSLQNKFSELPGFLLENNNVKVPLAWIIENICHMKGSSVNGARVYEKHALVIVNDGRAEAQDIRDLSENIKRAVYEKTGITVEEEVQFIGKF